METVFKFMLFLIKTFYYRICETQIQELTKEIWVNVNDKLDRPLLVLKISSVLKIT